MTTTKQADFLASLVKQRWHQFGTATMEDALTAVLSQADALDTRGAGTLINRLQLMELDVDPSVPDTVSKSGRFGVNGSVGPCSSCGAIVAKGEGFYYRAANGGWDQHHKVGECPTVVAPTSAPIEVVAGMYVLGDDIVRVYRGQSGHLCGKVLNRVTDKFVYQAGMARACAHGRRMTWEEAAEYGKRTSSCINCGRELSDDGDNRSLAVGYGPKCAERNGWPWG